MPYGIDEPQTGRAGAKANRLDLPELIVDLYNVAKSANAMKGSKMPKSVPVELEQMTGKVNMELHDTELQVDMHICYLLRPSDARQEHLLCHFLDHQ